MTSTARSLIREPLGFLLHLPVGTIGGALAAFFVLILLMPLSWVFGNTPAMQRLGNMYDPVVWLPSFGMGFLINRRKRHFSAVTVGLAAGVLFLALMQWDISSLHRVPYYANRVQTDYQGSYWRYELVQFFSPEDTSCGASECLGKLLFTFPFFASIAYSIGAWLGLMFPKFEDGRALASNH